MSRFTYRAVEISALAKASGGVIFVNEKENENKNGENAREFERELK